MPDQRGDIRNGKSLPESSTATDSRPTVSALSGSTFGQRRENIFRRLQQSVATCCQKYSGRKELASEKDDDVLDLCEALEDTFGYGLRQQQSSMSVTAASLFQNMQEIVTGNVLFSSSTGNATNESNFWTFCETHLTQHEKERYTKLKNVWTNTGRGRAFIRATLNENSLHRYLLIWLNDKTILNRFYTQWSLLLNAEVVAQLPSLLRSLDQVLFALTVDSVELNAATRHIGSTVKKEEPIIYAPPPTQVSMPKNKRTVNIVDRPIDAVNATEYLESKMQEVHLTEELPAQPSFVTSATEALNTAQDLYTIDPIEPELEFLKQPLPDFSASNQITTNMLNGRDGSAATCEGASAQYDDMDDKSDTSSEYSKTSSANCSSNQVALEERLLEMSERCALLETRVAELTLENRLLTRRLTQYFNESGIDPSSSLATNFLITIPQVHMQKTKTGTSFYMYEVHITMRQRLEHWTVLRRYSEFYKLHKTLLRTHPNVAVVQFPPKKHFGNKNSVFVDERRQQLQIYLLNLVETLPQVEACKTKAELQKVFPFLRER